MDEQQGVADGRMGLAERARILANDLDEHGFMVEAALAEQIAELLGESNSVSWREAI